MKLSIIVPCYNEEKTIIEILERLQRIDKKNFDIEIIVINDCSVDQTLKLLEENKQLYNILLNNSKNSGKGFSVKRGMQEASGEYIFFQDADLEYDVNDITKFINLIIKFKPDMIIGSRFNYSEYTRSHNFFNKIGNMVITNLFNILYNTTFTDIYCCYLCFKKNLFNIKDLKTNGWEQHAEILAKITKTGSKFYEVPVNYDGRTMEEGKKIRFYHIFKVICTIIKERIF